MVFQSESLERYFVKILSGTSQREAYSSIETIRISFSETQVLKSKSYSIQENSVL